MVFPRCCHYGRMYFPLFKGLNEILLFSLFWCRTNVCVRSRHVNLLIHSSFGLEINHWLALLLFHYLLAEKFWSAGNTPKHCCFICLWQQLNRWCSLRPDNEDKPTPKGGWSYPRRIPSKILNWAWPNPEGIPRTWALSIKERHSQWET